MSSETINPIEPARFAQALEALPVDSLHAKAAELLNSINHLKSSNEQMLPFADEGDQDCKDAMYENLTVIGRTRERISLIRAEVEKRGMRWFEGEVEDAEAREKDVNMTNGDGELVNGTVGSTANGTSAPPRQPSGRLTDAELRRRLEEQMGEDDEDGVHL